MIATARRAPISPLIVMTVLLSAAAYLNLAQAGDPVTGRQASLRPDAPARTEAQTARGQYILYCAGCHGQQGDGVAQAYVPGLRNIGQFLSVPGGREYLVSVPGMMSVGLTDAQIARVINYLFDDLASASRPAGFQPYQSDEVARIRQRPLTDVAGKRIELLQALAKPAANPP